MYTELNKGGFPVKNASYWKRQCNKLEEENAELRLSLIDIRSDLQNSNAMNVKLAYTNDELRAENAELRAQLARCVELIDKLQDLAIWMTGCGYDFYKLDYFKDNKYLLTLQLPDTAKYDAEILRCAKDLYADYDEDELTCESKAFGLFWYAVAAREDARCRRWEMNDNAYVNPLEKENAELRAQLARCVEVLEKLACLGNGDRYGNSEGNALAIRLIESLPATAKKDAEILRLVDNGLVNIGNGEWRTRITEQQEIASAVRAREE